MNVDSSTTLTARIHVSLKCDSVSSATQTNFVRNAPPRVVFSTLLSVFGYPDETLSLTFDISSQLKLKLSGKQRSKIVKIRAS